MILTCPACGTQYAVKDGTIPAQGRKVRCASCGESWHQQPESSAIAPEEEAAEAAEPAEATVPEQETPAQEPAASDEEALGFSTVPPVGLGAPNVEQPAAVPVPPADGNWDIVSRREMEREFDPEKEIPDAQEIAYVDDEDEPERRRSWGMAIILGLALVVALAAAFWLLAPDSMRRNLGVATASTPLQITAQGDRQTLASGNDLLAVTGRVVNPTDQIQRVPPIQAQLRDSAGKVLHSWTIAPPVQTLAPGASTAFNSAETGVPAAADQLTVTLGEPARG